MKIFSKEGDTWKNYSAKMYYKALTEWLLTGIIPQSYFLTQMVMRIKIDIRSGEKISLSKMATLHFLYNLLYKKEGLIMEDLDLKNNSVPYLMGRLWAAMVPMAMKAYPNNPNIIEESFSSFTERKN